MPIQKDYNVPTAVQYRHTITINGSVVWTVTFLFRSHKPASFYEAEREQ